MTDPIDTSPDALRALADRINPKPGEFPFGSNALDAIATVATTLRALAEREADAARLRDVVTEFHRLSLVIDSAVRCTDPAHAPPIAALMQAARTALAAKEPGDGR
jgi:hypothetical protein